MYALAPAVPAAVRRVIRALNCLKEYVGLLDTNYFMPSYGIFEPPALGAFSFIATNRPNWPNMHVARHATTHGWREEARP